MSALGLASRLPAPKFSSRVEDNDEDATSGRQDVRVASRIGSSSTSTSQALTRSGTNAPPYGKRKGWRPQSQADFGDGGAYPECHVAQYPLDMGKLNGKSAGKSGGALALQLDEDGNVRYDAIVQQGRKDGQHVQSTQRDLVPLRQRPDFKAGRDDKLERPSEEEVQSVTERTRLALEKITQTKIKATNPNNVPSAQGNSTFIRYTPGQQGSGNGNQRIIKMTEVAEDPLEPARWKHKKVPRGPPSPPPPVLRSPPRNATKEEQAEWAIPPCISNWKNNRGYTIALDKRLASDGRGLQDVHINDGFAQFSEALTLADRHAREEVRQRASMQQKLAAKEKAAKEEHLRMLAQQAREGRAGMETPSFAGGSESASTSVRPASAANDGRIVAAAGGSMPGALAAYGSDSGESNSEDSEDEEAARERDRIRAERKRERERDLRMSNMGTEQRAKLLAKEQNRDISEKVALGLAKPSGQGGELDARLFNRETFAASFGEDDSYNLYDKPLLQGSSAAEAIYRRPGGGGGTADDIYGGGTDEGIGEELKNDRFGLGKSKFEGTDLQEERHGPVQFEKDTADPFAIGQFLDDAKRGTKRGGLELTGADRKKQRDDA